MLNRIKAIAFLGAVILFVIIFGIGLLVSYDASKNIWDTVWPPLLVASVVVGIIIIIFSVIFGMIKRKFIDKHREIAKVLGNKSISEITTATKDAIKSFKTYSPPLSNQEGTPGVDYMEKLGQEEKRIGADKIAEKAAELLRCTQCGSHEFKRDHRHLTCLYCNSEFIYNFDGTITEKTIVQGNTTGFTDSQRKAFNEALSYLEAGAFSRYGLIEQLKEDNIPFLDANFAVDHLKVDWFEQAYREAKDFLKIRSFTLEEMIEQLKYDRFSYEQAEYGATKALQGK
ncbi:MAG: Ltp family lipoprotein [Dehalococcoidales bacterium]|nr:Ltp family lipoprotein [Dehalococcoidales bacterium]